ncbi:IclR family transcriptional regulator [Saliphagus sp. LR7]|uniref:IclR family transcriptional regulator n=1 Tax=Saliphagus sp. LR7 TaxID=2282654 RepID=UPI000DF7CEA0|nr:IclR family transcriptional regulator [Saliphagus sp. LR7]
MNNNGNGPDSPSKNRISAVERAFEIINVLRNEGPYTATDLSDHLDIPKSTAYIYLRTLQDLGYVINEKGTYRLSLRFLELGGDIRREMDIYNVARGEIDELSHKTGEIGTIGYEENGQRVLLYISEPHDAVADNATTGEYTEMHWTAVGKALLSQRSDDEIRAIVEESGLPKGTEHTITDIEELLQEIDTIRSQGYSLEDEERTSGVRALSIPIESGEQLRNIAISIAGPKHRFSDDRVQDELLPELRNTANVIELQYKHY